MAAGRRFARRGRGGAAVRIRGDDTRPAARSQGLGGAIRPCRKYGVNVFVYVECLKLVAVAIIKRK